MQKDTYVQTPLVASPPEPSGLLHRGVLTSAQQLSEVQLIKGDELLSAHHLPGLVDVGRGATNQFLAVKWLEFNH